MSQKARLSLLALACALGLGGCQTASLNLPGFPPSQTSETASTDTSADPQTTGTVPVETAGGVVTAPTGRLALEEKPFASEVMAPGKALDGADQFDSLTLGKRAFRLGNYGLAETHFRRAAEQSVNDAEAWLGLAASYDRLKRFDLADRAYKNLLRLTGPTPEVLNNIGYSYILRGDYNNARSKLAEALAKDPSNPYVQSNIAVLEKSIANRKGVR